MKLIRMLLRLVSALIIFSVIVWFLVTQPLFITPQFNPTPEVDISSLKNTVEALSIKLPARMGSERDLKPTLEWIEEQIKPYAKSYRQSFKVKNETFHNVLLDFGPESDGIIIIGAHYDTAHGYPGADDNASGVAALIELARLLSENQAALKGRVQLVFYTLEEPPYFRSDKMGSFVHAYHLKEKKQKVKLMIALDMIGYFTDEKNSQHFPIPLMEKAYSNQGNFIAVVGNLSNILTVRHVKSRFKSATKMPVYSMNSPAFIQGVDFSDHLNFWYFDYPAVMITDTSFMRSSTYHTKQDTAEKLNYVKMAEVVKALFQVAIDP